MCQGSIPLCNDIRSLLPEAVRTPDAQLLAVSRMEAIVDRNLEKMRMSSMSLA